MNRLERWECILGSGNTGQSGDGKTPLLQVCVDLHGMITGLCDLPIGDEMDRCTKALCARLEDWTESYPQSVLFDGAVKQVVLAVISEYREHRLKIEPDRGTVVLK